MKNRKAKIIRKTKETDIKIEINMDKPKPIVVKTSIGFLDHMLTLLAYHGNFSLKINACGDTHIDNHHLVEDIGISLGMALDKALGKRTGINRYGSFLIPMDEALSYVSLDISGRPFLDYDVKFKANSAEFDYSLLEDFFYSFAINSKTTLHISLKKGRSNHHIAESVFKGLGRSIEQAAGADPKKKGIPSTKGKL
ncbi:MAG: imidazoleglycerol-phosphate dehydratase HisB [Elusimicrobia bacterium]|nr:imidazoleglycerol-phosphate dehydratase HisB [Candidatus Liberimonas magnetica]